jgi:flagellar hook assembly protein FlgD
MRLSSARRQIYPSSSSHRSSSRLPYMLAALLTAAPAAHAIGISAVNFSNTTLSSEKVALQSGTTFTFTTNQDADITVSIYKVQNVGDALTAPVATLSKGSATAGPQSFFWNGLWLIDGDLGRMDGNYQFVINAATDTTATVNVTQLVYITSLDIHAVHLVPSIDTNQQPSFPYLVQYALAKEALVTIVIKDTNGATVRTLLKDRPQLSEITQPVNTISWNGVDDDGHPVPIGIYSVTLDAKDAAGTDQAVTRTRSTAIQSLANINTDPKKIFEDSAFAFPNPARNGQTTIQFQGLSDNSSVSLKIYTIAGDLVLSKSFPNANAGTVTQFAWTLTNDAGKKVGRGLYFCVIRENSPAGVLQTVKKVAVIQ